MKWGVRRKSGASGTVSDDVVRVRESAAKLKTGGSKALSNKELQDLVTRMNLEQQYSRLTADQRKNKTNKGRAFVKGLIATGKTANEVIGLVNSPVGKLVRSRL